LAVVDETEVTRHWLDDPPTVAAVLVSHNGARWLPKVLASFEHMYHAPTAWSVVDVASTDGSLDLLRNSFGDERITHAPAGTGFGAAVKLGLAELPTSDWIWLLHDDAAVLPGTLSGLLDTATSASDIAVVGPKIREWPSLRRLLEVGVTITSTGARETGLETGEPDAGQHDRPRDVLAVNTAGVLIRRDVWDELDGFDPHLPLHFDDIDFGWRLARAGYRTRTAQTAVLLHA
jgi:GT2 family glycosyltransferase